MRREELLVLVERLGHAVGVRSMRAHLRMLRLYYLALRHGLTEPDHSLRMEWSEETVLEWMRLLHVPPYEHAYPPRAEGSPCSRCGPSTDQPVCVLEFPGGAKLRCRLCGDTWLEEPPPAWRARRSDSTT
jgi:hypothetical protein